MKKERVIITFADKEPYISEAKNLEKLCKKNNIDFILYDMEYLKSSGFYQENYDLLQYPKAGFCCWKPYIILESLKKYKKVLYLDSSNLFYENSINSFFDNTSPCSTSTIVRHLEHTDKKTAVIMELDFEKYKYKTHIWAGVFLATNNELSKKVLNEWLKYVTILDCVFPNKEYSFGDHWFDQSILSLIFSKYHIKGVENYFFVDTRDPGHLKEIEKNFGIDIIANQKELILKYLDVYNNSASCCWQKGKDENGKMQYFTQEISALVP